MDKKRGEREDDPSREERQRGAHLESDDLYWIKRLVGEAKPLLRLAEHEKSIIDDAKNREWWAGFRRRVKVVAGYVTAIIASIAATIAWVRMNLGKWPWW